MTCADALSRRLDYIKGGTDSDNMVLLTAEHIRRMHVEVNDESDEILDEVRAERGQS
jgi:hypothetical protein